MTLGNKAILKPRKIINYSNIDWKFWRKLLHKWRRSSRETRSVRLIVALKKSATNSWKPRLPPYQDELQRAGGHVRTKIRENEGGYSSPESFEISTGPRDTSLEICRTSLEKIQRRTWWKRTVEGGNGTGSATTRDWNARNKFSRPEHARDLIKDALRFISKVEWNRSLARVWPPWLHRNRPTRLFIRPNKPAPSIRTVRW